MIDQSVEPKPLNIVVVCSANRCRSPLGEVLLADALRRIGRSDVTVSSAGFFDSGVAAEAESITAALEVGLTLAAHRSRTLNQSIVDEADLILTMERAHVRELAVRFRAFAKSFTVKEFERRAVEAPAQREEDFAYWVARLHIGRSTADLMGTSTEDEVADPIGKSQAAFDSTRDELAAPLTTIARLIP